MTTNRQSR